MGIEKILPYIVASCITFSSCVTAKTNNVDVNSKVKNNTQNFFQIKNDQINLKGFF